MLAVACGAGQAYSQRIDTTNASQVVLQQVWGYGVPVQALYTPDGKNLVVASWAGIAIYDGSSLSRLRSWNTSNRVRRIAVSADAALIAAGSVDGTITLWRIVDGSPAGLLKSPNADVRALTFSPDGKFLYSADWSGAVVKWALSTGTPVWQQSTSNNWESLSLDSTGGRLAVGSGAGRVTMMDAGDGHTIWTNDAGDDVRCLAFVKQDQFLASCQGGQISFLDGADGRPRQSWASFGLDTSGDIWAIAADDKYVAAAVDDRAVVFDAQADLVRPAVLTVLTGHRDLVRSLSIRPNGTEIVSVSEDGSVRVWPALGGPGMAIPGYSAAVGRLAFQKDGSRFAVGYSNGLVQLRQWPDGANLGEWPERVGWNMDVALSPDGATLAGAGLHGLQYWGTSDQRTATLLGDNDLAWTTAFSPDGKMLAGRDQQGVALWSMQGLRNPVELQVSSGHIISIAFSPDGQMLAGGSDDGEIRFWNIGTRRLIYSWKSGGPKINQIAFSPDGRTLASADDDATLQLWDTGTAKVVSTLQGNSTNFLTVAFSPDGSLLATGSADGLVRLWDAAHATLLTTLTGHNYYVTSVKFAAAGDSLVSASADGTIRIWGVKR